MSSSTTNTLKSEGEKGGEVKCCISPTPEDTLEKASVLEITADDFYLVGSDDESVKRSPRHWSLTRKYILLLNLAGLGLSTNLSILMCSPAVSQILNDFHSTSSSFETLVVSIWNLGAVLGGLMIGPLSEVYGRLPVYNVCNISSLVLLVGQTQTKSVAQLLALRFLNGVFVATTSLNPAVVADIFPVEQRGRAQSFISLFLVIGPIVGPIIGGAVAQYKGWRWIFWLAFFINAFFAFTMLLQFRETYEIAILRRKARKLRKETGDPRWRSEHDRTTSVLVTLLTALLRPLKCFRLLIFQITVIPGCLGMGYNYVIATTLPTVFQRRYHFSESASGLAFIGMAIGMGLGAIVCGLVLDRYSIYMKKRLGGHFKPEWRLPPMLLSFILAPAGLTWYGWSAQRLDSYIVPIIGAGLIGLSSWLAVIPYRTYLTDAFGIYRASGMAALTIVTNLLSAVVPLVGPPLYDKLDLGWGNTVLGFVAAAFIPLILYVLKHGETIRIKSRIEERLQ